MGTDSVKLFDKALAEFTREKGCMQVSVQELLGARRDSAREELVKRQLRGLPEPERFAFIQECISRGGVFMALLLAKSCLRSNMYFVALLEQALQTADASSMRYWLACTVAKLGGLRVTRIVASQLESNPDGVAKAIYWLPSLLRRDEPNTVAAFHELKGLAGRRGIIRGPKVMPHPDDPERVLFGNVWAKDET